MLTIEKVYDKNIVLNSIENGFNQEIQNMKDELISIKTTDLIEEVGFKAGWLDLSKYMNGSIEGHILGIIQAYKNIGTYNSYRVLLKSFFGDDAVIEFDNYKAGCLSITITTAFGNKTLQTKEYIDIQLKNGELLLAKNVVIGLTTSQLEVILQKIIPAGIYVTFIIN